jgi:hypothetical protein
LFLLGGEKLKEMLPPRVGDLRFNPRLFPPFFLRQQQQQHKQEKQPSTKNIISPEQRIPGVAATKIAAIRRTTLNMI